MGWELKISMTFGGETIKADFMFGHLEEQKCMDATVSCIGY